MFFNYWLNNSKIIFDSKWAKLAWIHCGGLLSTPDPTPAIHPGQGHIVCARKDLRPVKDKFLCHCVTTGNAIPEQQDEQDQPEHQPSLSISQTVWKQVTPQCYKL